MVPVYACVFVLPQVMEVLELPRGTALAVARACVVSSCCT